MYKHKLKPIIKKDIIKKIYETNNIINYHLFAKHDLIDII